MNDYLNTCIYRLKSLLALLDDYDDWQEALYYLDEILKQILEKENKQNENEKY